MVTLYEGNNTLNVQMVPIAVPTNLYGIVSDIDMVPLPGVSVTLDGLVTTTDSLGQYQFTDLVPGNYTITFVKAGYETVVM